MAQPQNTELLRVGGMTCVSCAARIERALKAVPGVIAAELSYAEGTAQVSYNPQLCNTQQLREAVTQAGYEVLQASKTGTGENAPSPHSPSYHSSHPHSHPHSRPFLRPFLRPLGLLVIILALFYVLNSLGILGLLVPSQLAAAEMPLIMLFVIGLITSVHCLAMCGGINISQSLPRSAQKQWSIAPALLYNAGRVISYTLVGAILGTIGLVLAGGGGEAGIPTLLQGALKLAAGVCMVVMGINLLGVFPSLRKLTARLRLPGGGALSKRLAGKGAFAVGLLNGLMPCGPLQSMQIIALATANPLMGALAMLVFGLGTVPAMLGLGSLISALGRRFAQRVMTVGATLVVVLGLAVFSQGINLTGVPLPALPGFMGATTSATAAQTQGAGGVQLVETVLEPGAYPSILVASGTPVRWIISAPEGSINGCNARAVFQSLGQEHVFTLGQNIIEFTPEQPGTYGYSCWMGMIQGTITVT